MRMEPRASPTGEERTLTGHRWPLAWPISRSKSRYAKSRGGRGVVIDRTPSVQIAMAENDRSIHDNAMPGAKRTARGSGQQAEPYVHHARMRSLTSLLLHMASLRREVTWLRGRLEHCAGRDAP